MAGRLSRFLPPFVGIGVPLILLLTNAIWNYASILLTMVVLVWLGFAIIFLSPSGTAT